MVGDFERDDHPRFRELLALVDHLILSAAFAKRITRTETVEDALSALWDGSRAMVILTDGEKGCWFRDGSANVARHYPALPVEATDTTGCGDIFHGGYAVALAEGRSFAERLALASGAAGFKASEQRLGTRAEVEALLASAR